MSGAFLPDVNVLLALTLVNHRQHDAATDWVQQAKPSEMLLCRVVQLGFLRLLTTQAALAEYTMTNAAAWSFHDQLLASGFVRHVEEPVLISRFFRERSEMAQSAPKRWNDAYLSSFATILRVPLITFDTTLARYTPGSVLLKS